MYVKDNEKIKYIFLIDRSIYTKGSKGQNVSLKGLCEYIIVNKKINNFYNSITDEQNPVLKKTRK